MRYLLVLGGLGIVTGAFWLGLSIGRRQSPAQVITLVVPPGIEYANARFHQRGGRYIWGDNDCSIYVLDYLKASGVRVRKRLTTKELFDPLQASTVALKPVDGPWKPGDVVVFRYQDPRPAGHCGVVISRNGELGVIHNAASEQGVVHESKAQFEERAARAGAQPSSIRCFTIDLRKTAELKKS